MSAKRKCIPSKHALFAYAISLVVFLLREISKKPQTVSIFPDSSSRDKDLKLITPAQTCRRKCLHPHRNKIYYAEPTDAGLDDRIHVIKAMTDIAGFLCADLILKPPSELLQPYHNTHTAEGKLSSKLEWSDFWNATNIEDNTPALHSTRREFGKDLWEDQPPCYINKKLRDGCIAFDHMERTSKYQNWLHIVTEYSKRWSFLDDFMQVYNASWDEGSGGFLWEIRISYWYLPFQQDENLLREISPPTRKDGIQFNRQQYLDMLPVAKDPTKGCIYANHEYSSSIKLMQKSLQTQVIRLALSDASIGLLHLRRGDTLTVCDTTIDKVKEYLYCSLGGMKGQKANVTLVMISDERDSTYRNEVMGLISEFSHMTMLDGDAIVESIVAEAANTGLIVKEMVNNYVTFAIEAILRDTSFGLAEFLLVRRRKTCRDCETNLILK